MRGKVDAVLGAPLRQRNARLIAVLVVAVCLAGGCDNENGEAEAEAAGATEGADSQPRVDGEWRVTRNPFGGPIQGDNRDRWAVTPECPEGACSFSALSGTTGAPPHKLPGINRGARG